MAQPALKSIYDFDLAQNQNELVAPKLALDVTFDKFWRF